MQQAAILPLLILAFFLQGMLPIVAMDFYLALLVDDAASLVISIALCLAIPYSCIRTKFVGMAYSTFCLYSLLHNIIIELKLSQQAAFTHLAFVVSISLFGFLAGAMICVSQFEKNK